MQQSTHNKIQQFRDLLYQASKIERRTGNLHIYEKTINTAYEKVERKGGGHPDTLADALASAISRAYCEYTVSEFGLILNHNFDKIGFMGGKSVVEFGRGEMISPIRILLNGRASSSFGSQSIPVKEIMIGVVKDFISNKFPMLNFEKDCKVMYEVRNDSTAGQVVNQDNATRRPFWYKPRSIQDVEYIQEYIANDMSTGYSYYPLGSLARLVLSLENYLNSSEYKKDKPWLGSDIKITAVRHEINVYISIVVPQICSHVVSVNEYNENLKKIKRDILLFTHEIEPIFNIDLAINTRDSQEPLELYITYTGSCVEMGDEGFVGRGNRANGLIEMNRPYSMEAPCGKNPAYSIGFVYTEAAKRISQKIYEATGAHTEISLTSQNARKILDPWDITVSNVGGSVIDFQKTKELIYQELDKIPEITIDFLEGKINPY